MQRWSAPEWVGREGMGFFIGCCNTHLQTILPGLHQCTAAQGDAYQVTFWVRSCKLLLVEWYVHSLRPRPIAEGMQVTQAALNNAPTPQTKLQQHRRVYRKL
jgi:hypothetical protein